MDEAPRKIVIAGAGYAGLHIAQRLGTWLSRSKLADIELIDRNDYHQVLTELPRVAAGSRSETDVKVSVQNVLPDSVRFTKTEITGFDFEHRTLRTAADAVPYSRLVIALGSRPNDFNIPGLADRVLFMWSSNDAVRVYRTIESNVRDAAASNDPDERSRLLTIVVGGGGATGVELSGAMAEELPKLAAKHGAPADLSRIILVEAGHTILAGSSPELVAKALDILAQLGVRVMTNSVISEATDRGLVLKSGQVVDGGTYVWAGGVKAPALVSGSGLSVGYNGRVKVDRYLRALDHSEIYVAGDLASVPDPETGMSLPPLAQIALSEGETVAENLRDEVRGRTIEPFRFRDKGFVVSVGGRRGVADVDGITFGGRLAHVLKEAIEWEYRQSLKHLHGWAAG
ncbi:MAG TPA: NAD(P)/FAD-dependent oxidoreductase [Chloroflexota bacterium]|jgi:NADH dehydrogenase|nr:NAD(P)/FAD-dependent oxidoreductase [Chloroflexota bacterium]